MKIFLIIYITMFPLLFLSACSESSKKKSAPIPVEVTFSGTGEKGIFDPSLAEDPSTGTIWMSYSSVNISEMWVDHDAITTRLAYSDDNGLSWHDNNTAINIAEDFSSAEGNGTWANEVSCIIYDKGAALPSERWKILWHRYLWFNRQRQFAFGWIAMKTAPSPNGPWSSERKLFSGSAYDNVTDTIIGQPEVMLDKMHSELNSCVAFTEPGMLSTDNALYLSLLCAESSSTDGKIVLLKWPHPDGPWEYKGAFMTNSIDGPLMGYDGFSAPEMFEKGGDFYLIATPQTSDKYLGTYIFEIEDLETAAIKRNNGAPEIYLTIFGVDGSHNGAAGYISGASGSGILYSEVNIDSEPFMFQIFSSGINP
ncbi:exo-alpha-sialidase [Spirochaetota bacterium]